MILLLKIILGLFVLIDFFVTKTLYSDYKLTKKSEQFEDASVADRIKVSFVFYFILLALIAFAGLLSYYIIMLPMGAM